MPLGSGGGLERDVVSEAFELGDEAAGGAFGAAAVEVVAVPTFRSAAETASAWRSGSAAALAGLLQRRPCLLPAGC